jgi:hypothetical protein
MFSVANREAGIKLDLYSESLISYTSALSYSGQLNDRHYYVKDIHTTDEQGTILVVNSVLASISICFEPYGTELDSKII